jgi:hypothetical protein
MMHPKYRIIRRHSERHVPSVTNKSVDVIMDIFEGAISILLYSTFAIIRKVSVIRVSGLILVRINKHVMDIRKMASSCFLHSIVHLPHGVCIHLSVLAACVAPGLRSQALFLDVTSIQIRIHCLRMEEPTRDPHSSAVIPFVFGKM